MKGHEHLNSSETAIRNHVRDGARCPKTQREEYRKKRKWNEESKEGNCMEKGHGGNKLSFGTVSAQALSKSHRKVRR